MATKGMTEFMSNGTAFTINDPNIADEFSASVAYSVGQWAYYEGKLYEFTAYHAAGSWNASHVKQILVAEKAANDMEEMNRAILRLEWDELMPRWINGAYNDSTGAFISLNTRVVSKKFKVYKGNSVEVKVPSGFQFKICRWNASGTFEQTGGWLGSGSVFYCNKDYIISIMATNDTTVNPNSFAGYVYVDTRPYRNTVLMNSINRQWGFIETNTQQNGVVIELKNGLLKLSGEASANTYWDIFSDLTGLPYGVSPGESYYLSFDSPFAENEVYITIYYNYGNGWVKKNDNLTGIRKITIPNGAVGMLIRLYVSNGVSFPDVQKINFTLSEQLSNRDLLKKINEAGGGSGGNSMQVRFLEERGTGDCTLIKFADGTTLMIDFGYPDTGVGLLESRFADACGELEISHIDYAIISHFHSDHCGLITEGVMDNYMNGSTVVYMPAPFTAEQLEGIQAYDIAADDGVYNTYTATIAKLNTLGCDKVYPTEGQEVNIGGSIVRFWNTDHTAYLNRIIAGTLLDYNYCSLCNFLTLGTVRIAFTGDASPEVLDDCKAQLLPSQIYKVNHHCAGYGAASDAVMNRLMPEIAVTLCGDTMVESTVKVSGQQAWFEANNVPNIPTGLNKKTLSMIVTTGGYNWNTPCRKYIVDDEE